MPLDLSRVSLEYNVPEAYRHPDYYPKWAEIYAPEVDHWESSS